MIGITTWNPPNQRAQIMAILQENLFVVKPLQMETEKASMERPMAMSNSSRKDIFVLLWRKNKTFFYRIDKKAIFAH